MREGVKITIGEAGDAKVEVIGQKGKGCLKLTDDLERALGSRTKRDLKREHYQQADGQQVHLGG